MLINHIPSFLQRACFSSRWNSKWRMCSTSFISKLPEAHHCYCGDPDPNNLYCVPSTSHPPHPPSTTRSGSASPHGPWSGSRRVLSYDVALTLQSARWRVTAGRQIIVLQREDDCPRRLTTDGCGSDCLGKFVFVCFLVTLKKKVWM